MYPDRTLFSFVPKFNVMARPIKETPILFGEDARRFEARMNEERKETPEEKAERLAAYHLIMSILKN